MDVHLTSDNVIVVSHDDNLTRLCGENVKIADLKFEQLPPFSDEIELHFADGIKFRNENSNVKFPKLEVNISSK